MQGDEYAEEACEDGDPASRSDLFAQNQCGQHGNDQRCDEEQRVRSRQWQIAQAVDEDRERGHADDARNTCSAPAHAQQRRRPAIRQCHAAISGHDASARIDATWSGGYAARAASSPASINDSRLTAAIIVTMPRRLRDSSFLTLVAVIVGRRGSAHGGKRRIVSSRCASNAG